ncbi:PREDICTED: uncharacterized protein MAL13P1.304-like [Polistes dominula]|uniref:Uncharacterized protein MAL13P1.304-like n=1 Tax=Polistes dominula TaxID=743375 RepID=A0ABM1IKJ5_POLDO|nr:PREDICTED: uncharacterized protein MAL13P1.304-like [Polistes dominula]
MARAHQYIRLLDDTTTEFDTPQISDSNGEEIIIKQEPCDMNDAKMNDNCVLTNTQHKDNNPTKSNSSQEKNVPSTVKNLSNGVITNPNKIVSISMDNAITTNSKHIQQEKRSVILDESDQNVNTLKTHDNIKKSSNKLKKNYVRLRRRIYCNICLLSFSGCASLLSHIAYYKKIHKYFCNICSSKFCYHIKERNFQKLRKGKFLECHYCYAQFRIKSCLQAHVAHHHHIKEINEMNIVENDTSMINHSTVSHSVTPIKHKVKQQKRNNKMKIKTERTIHENVHNSEESTCKLLTTIKQEETENDDQVDELSMGQIVSNVPKTKNKPKENRTHFQPFVQIHVNKDMMEALFRASDNSVLNKSLQYDSNTDSNVDSNNTITNSNTISTTTTTTNNSIIRKSYALRSLNNSRENNNSVTSHTVVQKNNQSDDKLSILLNTCKKCIIPLVKCDDIVNVNKQTKLNFNILQSNTLSSEILQSQHNHKSINFKLTPRKRKHTTSFDLNNCTPQMNHSEDLNAINSSIEKSPIKITRKRSIYGSLQLPINNDSINNRKKRRTEYTCKKLVKHRLVSNKRMFGQKSKRSPRKNNIKNSEVSPTVKKLNTKILEGTKLSINNVELMEVKVSLVKLPEIKNEIIKSTNIRNETFPCQICNSLLYSEKNRKKHVKKLHTAYISSICKAKYTSKRLLLKHFLKEHCTWISKCCVCQESFSNRLLLKQHLLLHCIKITLSKNDRPISNKNFQCNRLKKNKCKPTALKIILRMQKQKPSKKHLKINRNDNNYDVNKPTEHQEIYNNGKNNNGENINGKNNNGENNNGENNNGKNNNEKQTEHQEIDNGESNQVKTTEHEEINNDKNNEEKSLKLEDIYINNNDNDDNDDNDDDIVILEDNLNANNADNCVDLIELLESDNTEVPCSSNMIEKPILDPSQVVDSTFIICNPIENTQTKLTLNISNSIQPSVNDDKNESITAVAEITAEKKKYPCSICKQQFQKLESLQQHKRTYEPSSSNYCSQCGIFFSSKSTLKNHTDATHNITINNSYKMHCQFCNQGFRTQNNLRIHELHYHAIAVTINNRKITDFLQISNGKNNRSAETSCQICGLYFDTVERYQLHHTYFSNDHIFPCKICNKLFYGLYMIHRHNKLFHRSADTLTFCKYKCIHCYEVFASELQFRAHMFHVHPNKQLNKSPLNSINYNQTNKFYVCFKCNIAFFSVTELFIHIQNFSNHGDYKCSKCSRQCYNLSILNEHMNLTHLDKKLTKKYMCNICGEVLLSETFLLCHHKHVHDDLENEQIVSTDTNQNPTNDLSIDEITDDDVLKIDNELALLTNPSNFSCSICPVKFDKEIHLKEHLIEYLDYGDYQCNECSRRFANIDFLNKHAENHLKPGMAKTEYYCLLCNEVCKSSMILESHVAHLHARIIFKDHSPKVV